MRRKAWVIRGRRIAQKVVDKCIVCKKARARTCRQVMGDLPEEKTRPTAPFEFTAIDLFGPYQVRDDNKKRVSMKVWGVVFCCMSSRAIHAELANTLSTESFLLAYQRFTALRGHPLKVWSDPGTNLVVQNPFRQSCMLSWGSKTKKPWKSGPGKSIRLILHTEIGPQKPQCGSLRGRSKVLGREQTSASVSS